MDGIPAIEASSPPQTLLSSTVNALEADTKSNFDLPPEPLFPKAGNVILAQKVLEDVGHARRSLGGAAEQSPVINVKAAHALYETITQAALALAEVINASSLPANRLPAEILSKIFSLVPRAYKNPHNPPHFPGRSSAFTRADDLQPITEVCRYWRQVAFGTPSLWSTVAKLPPTDSKVWLRAPFWRYYVHRCTDGPLCVDINTRQSKQTVALARRHRDRVRKLSVTVDSRDDLEEDKRLTTLSTPFPNVEHCQVIVAPPLMYRLGRETWLVTSRILPESCRSLRSLVLVNAKFVPFNSFLPEPGRERVSVYDLQTVWIDLFKLLSRCRALVTVGIYGMGRLVSEGRSFDRMETIEWAPPLPRRVQLPNLKELDLHDRCQSRCSHSYLCGRGPTPTFQSTAADTLTNYRISVPRAMHIPPTCRINIGVVHHPRDVKKLYAALLNLGSGPGPSIAQMAFHDSDSDSDSEVKTGLKILSLDAANLDDSPEPRDRTHVYLETVYSVPSWQDLTDRPTISSLPFFARLRELWIDADAHAAFMRVDLAPCALNLAELTQLETLMVRRTSSSTSAPPPVQKSDGASTGLHPSRIEGRGWEDRPSLATVCDLLKSLEPQAAADPTGNDIAGAL